MEDKLKLLDQVREKLRVKHYSIRTEQAYVDWIKRFVLFHREHRGSSLTFCLVVSYVKSK